MGKANKLPNKKLALIARELINPPTRNLAITGTWVFRFVVTSAQQDSAYTRLSVTGMLLSARAANTAARLIQAALLKRIEVWSPPTQGLTANLNEQGAAVVWYGTQSMFSTKSDINVANTPSYLSTKPPKDSTASFVSEMGILDTEILFKLTAPVGSVLDLHCMITLASEDFGQGSYSTTNAMTVGQTYYNCLDGGAGNVKPMSILTQIN